jgi:hypothetical protein
MDGRLVPGYLSCDILAGKRAVPGGMIHENDRWFVSSVVEPVVWPGFLVIVLNLDIRMTLTRRLGVKKWMCSEAEVTEMADRLRQQFRLRLPTTQDALSEEG